MNIQQARNITSLSADALGSWLKTLGVSGQKRDSELFLYLGPEAPGQVLWVENKPGRRFRSGSGSLEEFGRIAAAPAMVLVPGAEVLLTEVEVPHGNRARAMKSIPFLVEENLAEDVENLHFACGRVNQAGKTVVAVVSREKMGVWLAMLSRAGVEAGAVVPASALLPLRIGKWAIVAEGRDWLVRRGGSPPFAVDPENCAMVLELAETSDEAGRQSGVTFFAEAGNVPELAELLPGREIEVVSATFLEAMAEGYAKESAIDLLQGEYGRSAEWRGLWNRWQFFIWSLLLILFIGAAGFAVDYYRLSYAAEKLDAEMKSVFMAAFPDSKRADNPRIRMESRIKASRENQSGVDIFFRLYDQVAPVILQSPAFRLTSLRFKDGRFDFDLELESLQVLDNLKEELGKNQELRVEIKNATASGDKVRAIIQVTIGK